MMNLEDKKKDTVMTFKLDCRWFNSIISLCTYINSWLNLDKNMPGCVRISIDLYLAKKNSEFDSSKNCS